MDYEEWEKQVPERIKREPAWRFFAYPKALFLYDLVWNDCEKWLPDPRGRAVAQQIIRSAGSIGANIEEGYARGLGTKDYLYFIRISLGSARETKGWYYRGRMLISKEALRHRLALLDEVIALLVTELDRHRRRP